MVDAIFSTITDAVEGLASSLGSAVTHIVSMFWDTTANEGAGGFTFLGIILLVAVGGGLIYFAIRLILRAVRGVA